jgi:hypothetical protein
MLRLIERLKKTFHKLRYELLTCQRQVSLIQHVDASSYRSSNINETFASKSHRSQKFDDSIGTHTELTMLNVYCSIATNHPGTTLKRSKRADSIDRLTKLNENRSTKSNTKVGGQAGKGWHLTVNCTQTADARLVKIRPSSSPIPAFAGKAWSQVSAQTVLLHLNIVVPSTRQAL